MQVLVNRITNCNVYLNGVNLLGAAEECRVARVKAKMTPHKGLGMFGVAEFPAGLDMIEASIKWASFYLQVEVLMGSPFESLDMQVRGNIETYGPKGIVAQNPGVWLMTGAVKDMGTATFKQHENVDFTTSFTVYHAEQYINGDQTFLYDVLSNVFVVNGVDQLAQFRANLGG